MNNIDGLILEMLEIKQQKNIVVQKQQYENAANLRDKERDIEKNIFSMVFPDEEHDYVSFGTWLRSYLLERFGIEYNYDSVQLIRQIMRQIKLDELGI